MTSNKELLEIIETTVNYLNDDSLNVVERGDFIHRQMIDVLRTYKEEEESDKYLWGQRVIVDNQTIAIFRHYEDDKLWVELPDGVVQWRSSENIKPLPGGQL